MVSILSASPDMLPSHDPHRPTYRYKPPPKRKGRKLAEITGPAVVTTVDPKRGSRRRDDQGGGQGATAAGQSTRLERADRTEPSTAPERRRDPAVITAAKAPAPANDDRKPALLTVGGRRRTPDAATAGDAAQSGAAPDSERATKRSAIVTARKPGHVYMPYMTPEEHKRRGDAADALFREMKRQIAEKLREE